MGKEIVVDINPYQTRVVLMDNGSPSEIYIEQRGKERLVGNIYKGRVQNVLPGMQAAFVDVGLERNAFLYAGDVLPDSSDFQFGEAPELHQEVPNKGYTQAGPGNTGAGSERARGHKGRKSHYPHNLAGTDAGSHADGELHRRIQKDRGRAGACPPEGNYIQGKTG